MKVDFSLIAENISGEFYFDDSADHQTQLLVYSTDASSYQEKPVAVAIPKDQLDIVKLIHFASLNSLTLVPRAAGTSLAGQVVSSGIIVDISKYFNEIIEINAEEKWVRVQPGVIRDDLNAALRPFGLMFGPETSTANRAMIGGMIGNNSCGLHSMVWGNVRDHLLEVKTLLSDGSEATFSAATDDQTGSAFQENITRSLGNMLNDPLTQALVTENFPKRNVIRRNSGYALDALMDDKPINLCKLIAGSEGTLVFVTEARLNLLSLPPAHTALLCVHTSSVDEALRANLVALKHEPKASELVDKYICDFTIGHPEYGKNRFFIQGDPSAILMVEFMHDSLDMARLSANSLADDLKAAGLGYAFPILIDQDTKAAWDIRKAGLGLLRHLKGDAQPVNLIEDCAVAPEDLPAYIAELEHLLSKLGVKASYYAHAGAGELHVEPIINLKSGDGLRLFREILSETVQLVKKYRGSLSGEHGDGRLRGEYIPAIMGRDTYALFEQVKHIFDPKGVFNQGKITGTPRMDTHLRIKVGRQSSGIKTFFRFEESGGLLQMAEKCSGSGDCRKSVIGGGVMCPSYMATRQEKDTTRARANVLRQFLSNEHEDQPLNHPEIKKVLDLCISCKGCKTECPSGVDVAKMKAEYLQHDHDINGAPLRSKLIAGYSTQMKLASVLPKLYNALLDNRFIRSQVNRIIGFHSNRTIPLLGNETLRKWFDKRNSLKHFQRAIYFFCDEFTNYNDSAVGKKAILLLEALGYQVIIPSHVESGRTYLSKGFIRKAKQIAQTNIRLLSPLIKDETPLVGIEPSAILTFRDEYIDLAGKDEATAASLLAKHCYTIEEFLAMEFDLDKIDRNKFTFEEKNVLIHGHCYQKALSGQQHLEKVLGIPQNYRTSLIPSGCCGMAGSFGYETEHYEVSQQIGELILFPTIRQMAPETILAASGTSCRHQIKDGTGAFALHPVEILWDALIPEAKRCLAI